MPKAIVHSTGGITLEHKKALALHHDLGPGDRLTWFTTTGWMMWNYLVSGLLVGATIVLFDGDPGTPDLGRLWRLAAGTRCNLLGVSAPFLRMSPMTPVWEGEISRPLLGCAAAAARPDGSPAPSGEQGELVVTEPMPSMPVAFWGDEDGSRLRAAYFEDAQVCGATGTGSPSPNVAPAS